MTPAEIKQKIKEYSVSKWPEISTDNERHLLEVLTEAKDVYQKRADKHRWWNDVFRVIDLDGLLIGFTYAEVTGDNSLSDTGWEFDWDSLCLVEAVEKTITIYQPIAS